MMAEFTDNLFGKQVCSNRLFSKFFCQWWFSDCFCCLLKHTSHLPPSPPQKLQDYIYPANLAPHKTPIRNSTKKVAEQLTDLTAELGHCLFSHKIC